MTQGNGYDLLEALDAIDPATLDYEEWVHVGMALHQEGYAPSDWEAWSQRDPSRYHTGECEAKWRSFGGSHATPVSGGTIVRMAKGRGWAPARERDLGEAFGWDVAELSADPGWIEPVEIEEPPSDWDGTRDLIEYLEALFEPEEFVGYVTEAWEKDGKWLPRSKGTYTMTAGEITDRLVKYGQDLGSSIGTPNSSAGAWIRFNPLDGEGVRNDNVTDFRYALVESDELDIERQRGVIDEMRLPVAALVHSGNKSLHAIVRVDAKDYDEYRRRVDYLYKACTEHGLKPDTQNKNPSRLSRMPGVMRRGSRQYLIGTDLGLASWSEWASWIEEVNDDLPDIVDDEDLDDVEEHPEQLIEDMLFPGDKLLLAGPSKAGKSYLLTEMCIALATGGVWLGHRCRESRVLYINLELKAEGRKLRFKRVRDAMGADPGLVRRNIHYLDLRGKSAPLEQLSNSIIRRALTHRYQAIVIDPIYKVMMGDENSAEAVSKFCNQLDKLAETLGAAVVYCHHHSKGAQGQKQSQDRASGSGVFTRDADAQIDMIELDRTEALIKQQENDAVCQACARFLDGIGAKGWRETIPQDEQIVESYMLAASKGMAIEHGGSPCEQALLDAVLSARERVHSRSAWRIEGTFRELPRTKPVNIWFDHPIHVIDDTGVLSDLKSEGERGQRKDRPKRKPRDYESEAMDALDLLNVDGSGVTIADISEHLGCAEKTLRRRLKASEKLEIRDGKIIRR